LVLPSACTEAGEIIPAAVVDSCLSSVGDGRLRVIRTEWSPVAVTELITLYGAPSGTRRFGSVIRLMLNTTASASNGVPSWNVTPWRRVKSMASPSGDVSILSASSPTTWSSSTFTSVSTM
jgi:hypothetical protein